MSKILVEFDTETKTCSFKQDGQEVDKVYSVGLYGYNQGKKDAPDMVYSMELTRYEFSDDKTIMTRLMANKDEYENPTSTFQKVSDMKDFVIQKDEVGKDIAEYFGSKKKSK